MALTRRDFIKDSALAASAAALAADTAQAEPAALPRRTLGRIGRKESILGFGAAPMGSDNSTPEECDRLLQTAFDLGITYFDTAPVYGEPKSRFGNSEMKMRAFLQRHRNDIFLVTKANAQRQDRDGMLRQVEESLQRMGVDSVDLVHIHNLGDFDMDRLLGPQGALAGLREAKRRGLTRWIGTSGHMRPVRFAKAIETGEIDLTMNTLNFADRVNYDFEGLVLPVARRHGTAVVAMKVLGGAVQWRYDGKTRGVFAEHHAQAIRYALGIPGVCCAVIGFSTPEEVRQAAAVARSFRPLSREEHTALLEAGRRLAAGRVDYYGPVTG